jgi:predicted nucleic acid-binding protein
MTYLLDVNVLVAWGWADHADHQRAVTWIAGSRRLGAGTLLTSSIPQLGFVRVSVQRSRGEVTPAIAGKTLEGMVAGLGKAHRFLPDDHDAFHWPTWCNGASRTTDAHLLALAKAHGAQLATLDTGIPGAFLLP